MFAKVFGKLFGTKNDKELKKYRKIVVEISSLEENFSKLSDEELKLEFNKLRELVANGSELKDVLKESFAITREASKRVLNMRHFDVQLIGGLVLNDGRIAEMKTGEGKTLVATLAVILNAMSGKGVHVVTVNDYLAKRDAETLRALYEFLGFSVGVVIESSSDEERKEAYSSDITYGTNNQFGFDYLRDNMKYSINEKVQRGHNFAIVDEVDSILIDEARTPLIISGPTNRRLENYQVADGIAKQLQVDVDFTIDEKNRTILLTEDGVAKAEKLFGVDNLYSLENASLAHHTDQALKANYLFKKDVDYIIKDGEVIIVDEFTGRLSEGRRFSEGLHQALEAKEGVKIKEESQTLADITFQNYFRLYKKLAGMTGTAQTEATEFAQIYNLDFVSIPTNVPIKRKDLDDLIYKSEQEKFGAIIKKIKELNEKGQPVLVGTASIQKSEVLHELLKKEKIKHTVLNAKQHEKEAEIIKNAGLKGSVTIATNMAGRGVDIKIDDEIRALGGLYIIGTERHESRRIDNQLRGRSGRQGDEGASQFYLSLEDNLLRIFGGDRIKNIMSRLGIEEGEHIESKMVTRAVENAQKKVEGMHFESRKYILEYDDVANEQRKVIYRFRDELLNEEFDISSKNMDNLKEFVKDILSRADIFEGSDNFNLEKLVNLVKEEVRFGFNIEELQGLDFNQLEEYLFSNIEKKYSSKMEKISERNYIERIIYLQVLDNGWREHLYQMDILKTGIGLRGYNQKDPLVEYKKESYNLFIELTERIKFESIKTLLSIEFREREEVKSQEIRVEPQLKEFVTAKSEVKKVSKNDPCPCGSGKKYKYCCGVSGPKKGKLIENNS